MATAILCKKSITTTAFRALFINSSLLSRSLTSFSSSYIAAAAAPPTAPRSHPNEIVLSGTAMWHHNHRRSLCSGGTATPTVVQQPKQNSKSSSERQEEGNSNNDNSEQQQQQGKSVRGGPVSWLSFLLLIVSGAGLVFYYDAEKKRLIQEINTASTAVKQGPSAGKAAIGGPFNLLDHNGKAVTNKDFMGKWTVLYFGFTHCPDICPDELQKLAAAVDKIKSKSGIEIVPVFISVDPERDNVEQVHEYVKEFHPALIGLTGTPDEIKSVARAFRVYYMKTEEEGSDYLVDHSIVMYLMDPKMEFVKFYGKNNDVDSLTDGITNEIKQYIKSKA